MLSGVVGGVGVSYDMTERINADDKRIGPTQVQFMQTGTVVDECTVVAAVIVTSRGRIKGVAPKSHRPVSGQIFRGNTKAWIVRRGQFRDGVARRVRIGDDDIGGAVRC